MKSLEFTVYGAPIAQPRVKAQGFKGKDGRIFAHVYEAGKADSPARQWKHDVKHAAIRAALGGQEPDENDIKRVPLWTGPIVVSLMFFLPRPKNLCRKKDPPGPIPHVGQKDIDNLYKSTTDALQGVIFANDGQLYDVSARKLYHEIEGRPRAEIMLMEI